jgi:hypothetical protein
VRVRVRLHAAQENNLGAEGHLLSAGKDSLQLTAFRIDDKDERRLVRSSAVARELPRSHEGVSIALGLGWKAWEVEVAQVRISQEVSRRGHKDRPRADVVDDGPYKSSVKGSSACPGAMVDHPRHVSEVPGIEHGWQQRAVGSVPGG